MKSLIRGTIAVAAFSLAGATTVFAQAPKIAFINSSKIMAEAPGRADAEATYDREMGSARAQLQRMDDSLKTMVATFEKEAPALDSTRRTTRGNAIRAQEETFSKRAQALNTQMQQRQAELAKPLMDQVAKVLDEMRTQGGYAMIFDVGTPSSVVVSADKSLDITDQVLARLKQLGPPKASAAAPGTNNPGAATQRPAGITRPRG